AQYLARVLGSFVDEKPEFGAGRLEVRSDAVVQHLRGGGGPDGDDDDGAQTADECRNGVHLLRHHHQMNDLHGGGEQDDIDVRVCDAVHTFAQRLKVVRQRPLVDGDLDDCAGALSEFSEEFGVGGAVFLDGDAKGLQFLAEGAVHGCEDLMPGAWLRRGGRGLHLQLAKNLFGFGAAGDNAGASQCVEELLAVEFGFDGFEQRAHANAGEEEDYIDFAGEQLRRKVERLLVGVELDFAHRRHDEGLAAVSADELLDFFCPAGFQ